MSCPLREPARTLILIAAMVLPGASPATAQTAADTAAIRQAALDYIEGWYEGDAQRMERALHPDLAKRIVRTDARGRNSLGQMSALTLVQLTRVGDGKVPPEKQQKDVTVLDIFGNAATAKVVATGWIDYLHLARWYGRWVIVNVLWENKPEP
ncbi:MAG TPA: nuclear transport factor 2 family protein [Gemmatimonadales bacterium]|nr:nuclear transport factor 2 family protein [Gemmatimonadales bacterium]